MQGERILTWNRTKPRAPFRVGCSATGVATWDALPDHHLPVSVPFRFRKLPLHSPQLYLAVLSPSAAFLNRSDREGVLARW